MEAHRTVCVFCASSDHVSDMYRETAVTLGEELARRRITLVYGGGNNGLMGELAVSVHVNGGRVIGVIPEGLRNLGYAYTDADEMIVTEDLRQRKAIMEKQADGFICLPGGFGTLEETLEVITLRQLGMLSKPIVLINTNGFYNGLLAQFKHMKNEKFCEPDYTSLYQIVDSPKDALEYITA